MAAVNRRPNRGARIRTTRISYAYTKEDNMKTTNDTLVVFDKSKNEIISRFPMHLVEVDQDGRISVSGNYIVRKTSPKWILDKWINGAKKMSRSERMEFGKSLEKEGLKIARYGWAEDGVLFAPESQFRQTEEGNAYHEWAVEAARDTEDKMRRTVTILLVTRGWGDYGFVEWTGDITRPAEEIAKECREKLDQCEDKDCNLTDAEIIVEIAKRKDDWAKKQVLQNTWKDHVERCKAEAVKTGNKVAIRQYICDCTDKNEECSMDIATDWAMPDGTIKRTYQHTW